MLNFQKMWISQISELFFSEYDLTNKIYTICIYFLNTL